MKCYCLAFRPWLATSITRKEHSYKSTILSDYTLKVQFWIFLAARISLIKNRWPFGSEMTPQSSQSDFVQTTRPRWSKGRVYRRGYRISWRRGGGGAEDIHNPPPPWTLSAWTSSTLRKIEKHPHSWTFTSTPLGHCPCDAIHIPRGVGVIVPCHTHSA